MTGSIRQPEPGRGRLVRARIEAFLPEGLGTFAALTQAFRQRVMRRIAPFRRRRFWEDALEGEAAERAFADDLEGAADSLQHRIDAEPCRAVCRHPGQCLGQRLGKVWLVGAGPGDPALLTGKALRLMQRCDIVLHDRLVPSAILDWVRRDAEIIPVGKAPGGKGWSQERINRLMIERARTGDRVLRLKGGDPMILGFGGEERDALRKAGIPVTVVPGITAGLAAASAAGIALTDRRKAKQCIMIHGNALPAMGPTDLGALHDQRSTLVVCMAKPWLAEIRSRRRVLRKTGDLATSTMAAPSEQGRLDPVARKAF